MTDNKAEYSVLVCTVCGREYVVFCPRARGYSCMLCNTSMRRSEPLSWALGFSLKHELSADADEELAERMRHT